MGDSFLRRQLYEQVDMISLDVQFNNLLLVHCSALFKELVQPPREWAYENPLAILRNPNQVILQAVGRMCTDTILAHTTKHAALP